MPPNRGGPGQSNGALQALPLAVWPLTAGVAAAIIAVLFFLGEREPPRSEAFDLHNKKRFESFAEQNETRRKVVFIGDSRMRYALASATDLEGMLSESDGRSTAVIRVTLNRAVWRDFAGIAPLILEARPELVIVDDSLSSKEPAAPGRRMLWTEYWTWSLIGRGPWNPGQLDHASLQEEMRCEAFGDAPIAHQRNDGSDWVWYDPAGRNARDFKRFVEDAEASGIKVALVSLPVSQTIPQMPADLRAPEMTPLYPRIALPDDGFCDMIHLNAEGREIFSRALVPLVADLLRES